ncbi:EamA family transporter RarD [Micromonospora tarensis]|uniref:EamA family transporter RarD n=1 Tax=Micromonospora tarensis TaxID=2806100 RepID=A0ABS1YCF5_9ACTN|nr:EamA family transporter RarD [Micromonospora tarensis]MBM0275064.1 EamA family transporter RarD [Micromonospora tarensis]
MRRARTGVPAGTAAYFVWGLLTLYWPLLDPAPAPAILAHRIVWSLVFVAVVLAIQRDLGWVRAIRRQPRVLALLAGAGCFVGVNWGLYIWAVNNGRVIEAALGYYINPLFTALLGLAVLRERMAIAQWIGVALAATGVVWLGIDAGRPPWVAIGLAATFGVYGLFHKWAAVPSWRALAVETAALAVPAAGYLAFLSATGRSHFGGSPVRSVLFVGAGLVTALPLVLFGFAAVRTPLTVLGMLQFLLPTTQFVIGYFGLHESIGAVGLGAYCLVWAGAAFFLAAYAWRQTRAEDRRASDHVDRARDEPDDVGIPAGTP